MAEANQLTFSYKEIAEALIKKHDIHEGLWGIYVEFGLAAVNLNTDPTGKILTPAAINILQKIGIQRFPEANSLTVDAGEVNPPQQAMRKSSSKKKSG